MSWYINRAISDVIEKKPWLYMTVQKIRYRNKGQLKRLVAPDTDIMIEGFPRCANSFAVRAFLFANQDDGKTKIATHFHSPAHVISSVRMKIPTLVLIRNPDSAVISMLAFRVQFNRQPDFQKHFWVRAEKEKDRLIRYWTLRYAVFYNTLIPYAGDFVTADFNETTSDFSGKIDRINAKFKTDFRPFIHTQKNVQAIFSTSKPHLHPSLEREQIKSMFKDGYFSSDNRYFREKAMEAYQNFLCFSGESKK